MVFRSLWGSIPPPQQNDVVSSAGMNCLPWPREKRPTGAAQTHERLQGFPGLPPHRIPFWGRPAPAEPSEGGRGRGGSPVLGVDWPVSGTEGNPGLGQELTSFRWSWVVKRKLYSLDQETGFWLRLDWGPPALEELLTTKRNVEDPSRPLASVARRIKRGTGRAVSCRHNIFPESQRL